MIKFFRRIRQNLLSENKFSKYLIYAIGEIILVMIGILLALQVTNLNEKRQNQAKLKLYVGNLIESLDRDISTFEYGNVYSFVAHSGQYLLKQAGEKPFDFEIDGMKFPVFKPDAEVWNDKIPTEYDKNFIRQAYLWSTRGYDLTISTAVFDEMKSIGFYAQLPSEIKKSIERYFYLHEVRAGKNHFEKYSRYIRDFETSLGEEGLFNSSVMDYDNPLFLLKDNPERVFLLKLLIREAGWFSQSAERSKRNALNLKVQLKEFGESL